MMNKNKILEGDDRLWSSDVSLIAYLFQTKVMFLLKIMLIYDKPLLCGQPQLSSHLLVLGGRGGGRLMDVQLYIKDLFYMGVGDPRYVR